MLLLPEQTIPRCSQLLNLTPKLLTRHDSTTNRIGEKGKNMKTVTNRNQDKYLINWIGGKRLLRKKIAELIPGDIGSYIEPFGGGAWVLFYKDRWAPVEVYNDLNSELYNMFKIVKYHPEAFVKELRWMFASRELFSEQKSLNPETDIKKAARFFYLIQRSFGAKGMHFGTIRDGRKSSGKSHLNIINRIWCASCRFDKVLIEHLDFELLIEKYDCESAFFYCDPPYVEGGDYYEVVDKTFDHDRLRERLGRVKGRWLLSYGDNEYIRDLYKDFDIIPVSRQNTLNNQIKATFNELLIKNY